MNYQKFNMACYGVVTMETRIFRATLRMVFAREKLIIHFEDNLYTSRILEEFWKSKVRT